MRVTCPACEATYDVPDARIGAGRRLRCARCQHDWFVGPPAAVTATDAVPPAPRPGAESPFARAVERAMAPVSHDPASAPAPPPSDPAAPRGLADAPPRSDDAVQGQATDTASAGPDRAHADDPRPPDRAHPAGAASAEPARPAGPAPAHPGDRGAPGNRSPAPPLPPAAELGLAPRSAPVDTTDRSGLLMAAWVATLMLVVGFAAAVLLYRVEIMEAWPPAERFYAAIGMLRR